MNASLRDAPQTVTWIVLILILGAITGLAFAGWMRFGADILLAAGETGLNWCL